MDVESSPRSSHEVLVLLVHAVLSRLGFRLVALGETGPLVGTSLPLPLKILPSLNVTMSEEKHVPKEWNASREAWALRYRHSRSSFTFVVRSLLLQP